MTCKTCEDLYKLVEKTLQSLDLINSPTVFSVDDIMRAIFDISVDLKGILARRDLQSWCEICQHVSCAISKDCLGTGEHHSKFKPVHLCNTCSKMFGTCHSDPTFFIFIDSKAQPPENDAIVKCSSYDYDETAMHLFPVGVKCEKCCGTEFYPLDGTICCVKCGKPITRPENASGIELVDGKVINRWSTLKAPAARLAKPGEQPAPGEIVVKYDPDTGKLVEEK